MEEEVLTNNLINFFNLSEKLEYNWDMQEADPVPKELIPFTKNVIRRILKEGYPPPMMGVTPIGTYDIVWDIYNIYIVLSRPNEGIQVTTITPSNFIVDKLDTYDGYTDKSLELISNYIILRLPKNKITIL